jgi:DEAD/DEAH box helicase domain-containing protein
MLPSILAKQLKKGIGDYIKTTFPMTNEPFKGSVRNMLKQKGSVYHEPYVSVRLPFRVAGEMPTCF